MAEGRAQVAPVECWHGWATLSTQPLNRQVDGVLTNMLGGVAEPKTREVMLATRDGAPVGGDAASGPQRLRELIAIAFGSPEFQRR